MNDTARGRKLHDRKPPAARVDDDDRCSDASHGRVSLQKLELARETVWKSDVIRVETGDMRAPRQTATMIERGRDPEIPLVDQQPDARIRGHESLDDGARVVLRAIVHHHELQLLERLCEHAFDRLDQVGPAVEDGQDDAHARRRSAISATPATVAARSATGSSRPELSRQREAHPWAKAPACGRLRTTSQEDRGTPSLSSNAASVVPSESAGRSRP